MARKARISESSVGRIRAGNGLNPHRVKPAIDINFGEKSENLAR